MLKHARSDARKAVFLITDGYSNSGDPRPAARQLRQDGVEVFTFGIKHGNYMELRDMASEPKDEHTFILNTFEEFEALARRALHEGNDKLGHVQHRAGRFIAGGYRSRHA